MGPAVLTTLLLQQFLWQHPGLRDSAMVVAQTLRDHKHMATEGKVGDTLKSAPLFYLCAAMHGKTCCSGPKTLFRELSAFAASEYEIRIDLFSFDAHRGAQPCGRFARFAAGYQHGRSIGVSLGGRFSHPCYAWRHWAECCASGGGAQTRAHSIDLCSCNWCALSYVVMHRRHRIRLQFPEWPLPSSGQRHLAFHNVPGSGEHLEKRQSSHS